MSMFLVSIFELSYVIEDVLTALEIIGINREFIKAIPLDPRNENKKIFDTTHYSDGLNVLALPFIFATLGTFFGVIFGFQLYWGPIMWGFIGAISGFLLGLIVSVTYAITKKKYQKKAQKSSVVVIVECQPDQLENAKNTLWSNGAMGLKCLY